MTAPTLHMVRLDIAIRSVGMDDLPLLFLYLDDHLQDNGKNGTAWFAALSHAHSRFSVDKAASYTAALAIEVGEAGWRRAWIACNRDGAVVGHVDLHARPEPSTSHRCLLGIGVHRDYRCQGLGQRLLDIALAWARAQPGLDWMDLEVLSHNEPALRLYQRAGFATIGEIADMFRIDGQSLAYTLMTLPLGGG
jgi:ribosomal protein S18 acetylase RimI-like enzyme